MDRVLRSAGLALAVIVLSACALSHPREADRTADAGETCSPAGECDVFAQDCPDGDECAVECTDDTCETVCRRPDPRHHADAGASALALCCVADGCGDQEHDCVPYMVPGMGVCVPR